MPASKRVSPPASEPLPTVRRLADTLGVHHATVYRGISLGEIRAVRIGNALRIPWGEFRRLTGEEAA